MEAREEAKRLIAWGLHGHHAGLFCQVTGGCPGGGGVPGTTLIKSNLEQQGPVQAESPNEQICSKMELWAHPDTLISTIQPGHVHWF